MINRQTIISSFDDKGTLLKWLKAVENALDKASATEFLISKKGNSTISFILKFADDTQLESGDITLEQGESVESASIVNGHLLLTLTNGEVLDAGNLFNGNVNIDGTITASVVDATKVTGNEIVEKMSGYEFIIDRGATHIDPNLDVNILYAGAVKNGNKLTLSIFGNVTRNGALNKSYIDYGIGFKLPIEIANKLIPYSLSGATMIDNKQISFFSAYNNVVVKNSFLQKSTGNQYTWLQIYDMGSLTEGVTYYFRYEVTFLLSDSLASN